MKPRMKPRFETTGFEGLKRVIFHTFEKTVPKVYVDLYYECIRKNGFTRDRIHLGPGWYKGPPTEGQTGPPRKKDGPGWDLISMRTDFQPHGQIMS